MSVVIPAYNEAARLASTLHALREATSGEAVEVIVVDDGSTDPTSEVASATLDAGTDQVIRLDQNSGKGAAVRAGVLASTGDAVLYMDADNATDLGVLPAFVGALDRADVVVGSRMLPGAVVRDGTSDRAAMAWVFNKIVRVSTGIGSRDTQCGFKAFRGAAAHRLFTLARCDRFAFDVEVLLLARRLELDVVELPVDWTAVEGSSVRRVADSLRAALDVVRIAARWTPKRVARGAGEAGRGSVAGARVTDTPTPVDTLARCVGALDGDDRPGQRRLTEAISAAITGRHHLVAEAPTGSGKSLAYLSAIAASGVRAVVATATLTLQDQLWRKDLPLVQEHGGTDVTGALLKGRSNYLCLAKLEGARQGDALFDERPGPDFARELDLLSRFSGASDTGDVADLDAAVSVASWRAMTCGPSECPGAARCDVGASCFAEVARRRADDAAVVIVNHALYAAHLATGGRLLPEHDVVVIDEAHAFDRFATNALGADAAPGGLRQLAGRLRRSGVSADATGPLLESANLLEGVLEDVDGRVDTTTDPLAPLLATIDDRLVAAGRAVDVDKGGVLAAQGVRLALARLEAIRRLRSPGRDDVAWVDGGERPVLRLAPIAIGARLAPVLFAQVPVVLLSATLGPGARFEPLARRLGLDPASAPGTDPDDADDDGPGVGYDARRFESPFELRAQGMLYVPRSLPDVRTAEWEDAARGELCELVGAAGGRALILCTSWRNVRTFSETLRARTEHTVLAQGDDTTARLVAAFVADETSCLVATRAFWQGLDVPGPACVLVVIDRLPFSRPDDPLEQARREAVERDGGDGFREVDLPAAALALAQGTGRLIRTHRDRGVVAVLDRRLATSGYRSVLLEGLPPFRRVVDGEVARAFLETASAGAVDAADAVFVGDHEVDAVGSDP